MLAPERLGSRRLQPCLPIASLSSAWASTSPVSFVQSAGGGGECSGGGAIGGGALAQCVRRSTCSRPVSLLCHFWGFYPCVQSLPSLSRPALEPGFFGAIFPSSPPGCEHPGIRGHETPPLGHSWPSGDVGGRQEGSPTSLQVTHRGPWPRTKPRPGVPGAPAEQEGQCFLSTHCVSRAFPYQVI